MMNAINKHQIVDNFLAIQNQLKLFHWQTKSYARHMAFGQTYDALGVLIDGFIEVHSGKYGRIMTSGRVEMANLNSMNLSTFMTDTENFLLGLGEIYDAKVDSDLLNVRDEMLSLVNKLKYLLTLK